MPLRGLWKRVQSQFLPRPQGVKAWGRRLAIFTLERALESTLFGVLLLATSIIAILTAGGWEGVEAVIAVLWPEIAKNPLLLIGSILLPMAYFYVSPGYMISCVIFCGLFRQKRPFKQAAIITLAGLFHSVILLVFSERLASDSSFLEEVLVGLFSVFLANYLGASLLQRWDAAAAQRGR